LKSVGPLITACAENNNNNNNNNKNNNNTFAITDKKRIKNSPPARNAKFMILIKELNEIRTFGFPDPKDVFGDFLEKPTRLLSIQ
jgi:hypothetical protein